jgi:Animal haem peroxidase
MISPPYCLSRPDRYCRLLPPFRHSGDPEGIEFRLRALAESMHPTLQEELFLKKATPAGLPPAAGYTYFGQFIMHDLTFDDTPFRAAGEQEPNDTVNGTTPRLDLNSVYGDGPGSVAHGHLYSGIRFKVGTVLSPITQRPFDVPLVNGRPAVADARNCENAIVRQIHCMFLLLHNLITDGLQPTIADPKKVFETARSHVRWHFQRLVRDDFLPNVCSKMVYRAVVRRNHRLIHWPWGHFSIPVEFSQAASRFGHSMVRENYQLAETPKRVATLAELFESARGEGALSAGLAIDWNFFLRDRGEPSETIDTSMVNPLRELPDASIHPFVNSPAPHEPHMLAERTLCRGARTRLPTGQQMRVALGAAPIISETNRSWKVLRSLGFEDETPLWYYILLEAEINEDGNRLGAVGSRIVAEVIEACLRHDPESFLHRGGGIDLKLGEEGKEIAINNLFELAVAVGLWKEAGSG